MLTELVAVDRIWSLAAGRSRLLSRNSHSMILLASRGVQSLLRVCAVGYYVQ